MCSFWAGGISSFPFSRAREYRLLRRLQCVPQTLSTGVQSIRQLQNKMKPILTYNNFNFIVSTLNVLWILHDQKPCGGRKKLLGEN
jgi:hypothetical protein